MSRISITLLYSIGWDKDLLAKKKAELRALRYKASDQHRCSRGGVCVELSG